VAYVCPRCSGPVNRGGHPVGMVGGVVGALLAAAFGGFTCKKCGPIPKGEFPPDVQQKMTTGTVLIVFSAIAVLVVAITLIVWLTSMGR
jgi:hypothetical protein